MALIHTIQIASEKSSGSTVSSTRKSETRRYTACIVATTTEATIMHFEQVREKAMAKKAQAEKVIELLTAKLGMTVEEARAKLDTTASAWHKAFFAAKDEIRAKRGQQYGHVTDAEGAAWAKKNGAVNPYENEFGGKSELLLLSEAAHDLFSAERTIGNPIPSLGSEAVLSWHHSVPLAEKALASHDHVARQGDKLTVRTDITVTETKKRAPKAG